MNEKTARNLWIGATALVVALIIAAFVSGAETSINLSTPSVALANLVLSIGGLVAGILALTRGMRAGKAAFSETSWWLLVTWALLFYVIIANFLLVSHGSFTLDLPTGATFVLVVLLASAFLWDQRRRILDRRAGYPERDERIERIQGKAALYTLAISLSVMVIMLMFIVYLGSPLAFPEISRISAAPFLICLLAITLGTYFAFRWYLDRRRDS